MKMILQLEAKQIEVLIKGNLPNQFRDHPVQWVMDGRASYNGISFSIDATLNYGTAARIWPATDCDPQGWTEAHLANLMDLTNSCHAEPE